MNKLQMVDTFRNALLYIAFDVYISLYCYAIYGAFNAKDKADKQFCRAASIILLEPIVMVGLYLW